ncbi:MAG: hypothetical protein Q9M34_01240, partial [Sulfurimonas sp.]|nr:hypothetical protein [Sulfurimonas sp.]
MIFQPSELKRKLFFMFFDIVIITISTLVAFNLRFDFDIPSEFNHSIVITLLVLVLARVSLFYYFRIYNISWRHFGFKDTTSLVYVTVFSTILLVVVAYLGHFVGFVVPRSIIPIEFFISLFLLLALRISKRLYLENSKLNVDGKSTIIIAQINKANTILRAINNQDSDYYPIAIINNTNQNIKVNGVEVYSLDRFLSLDINAEVAIIDEAIELSDMYKKLNEIGIKNIKVASDYSDYGA